MRNHSVTHYALRITPMSIRVLIVDDSPFVCDLLQAHLNSVPDLQIVGMAHNGLDALAQIKKVRPTVVTLDQEMPQMGGLETLERIMHEVPTPVVMITGVSRRAAIVTRKAMQMGAVDFVFKYTPGSDTDPDALRRDIVAKVRAAANIKVIRSIRSQAKRPLNGKRRKPRELRQPLLPSLALGRGVVVIGASTGGPVALRELLGVLSADFPLPIVIVQHIPEAFTDILASQLDRNVPLRVKEADNAERLRHGFVYVAPGDHHLLFHSSGRIKLNRGPAINGHRPAIDVTMQSAAQLFGADTIGVVLTGMGADGTLGLVAIHAKGGKTFAQDAATCVVNGMPQRAIERGVVEYVGTPHQIATQLQTKVKRNA